MREVKYYLDLLIILVFLLSVVFMGEKTAYVTGGDAIYLGVANKTDGKITSFIFNASITIFDTEHISTEFTNTGTETYLSRIEVRIHKLINGSFLNLTATYQDASVNLAPGDRRAYSTVYINNETGVYFIQVRVVFGTRTTETWGSFFITGPFVPPPPTPIVINVTPGTGGGGAGGGGGGGGNVTLNITTIPLALADMNVTSPSTIDINRNDSVLLDIHVTNKGQVPLTNLRLFVSAPSSIGIEINPKVVSSLAQNDRTVFLVALTADKDTDIGKHVLNYDVVALEARKSGSVDIIVQGGELDPETIRRRIINYQLLILDIEEQMGQTEDEGFDTGPAAESLDSAKNSVEKAKRFYDASQYENARDALIETKGHIEDSVFRLALARIIFYEVSYVGLYIILVLLAIALTVLAFVLYKRKKRRPKRPKMLRDATDEG